MLDSLNFDQVQGIVEGLADVVTRSLRRVKPRRATAELGLSLKVEAGHVTGVLVECGGRLIRWGGSWRHLRDQLMVVQVWVQAKVRAVAVVGA